MKLNKYSFFKIVLIVLLLNQTNLVKPGFFYDKRMLVYYINLI